MQQRQREQELRKRRKEAESILHKYRASADGIPFGSASSRDSKNNTRGRWSLGTPTSENLDDPAKVNLQFHLDKEGEEKEEITTLPKGSSPGGEEKKAEDQDLVWLKKQEHRSSMLPPTPPSQMFMSPPDRIPPQVSSSESLLPETIWRDFISSEEGAKFPPEPDRYHLYVSYACPGSHRALIVRALKGLEKIISVTHVHPTWRLTNPKDPEDKHRGWVFGNPYGKEFSNTIGRGGPFPPAYHNTDPDPEFNAYSVRGIYERAGDTSGKYTIPLIWDKKTKTIVNNESSDIAYMMNSCFNDFAEDPLLDLYTEDDEDGRARLNEVSEWLSPLMIHGVYRCGFAKNQVAYDHAISALCEAYDRADDILQSQRYLTGDTLTDADIRLFVTLIRFDEVYSIYFKANARLVLLTPSLLNFCREIYQIPGVAATCDMEQIKAHFFGSHAEWNKYSVIPRGLGFMELLDMPHDRDELTCRDEDDAGFIE